MSQRCWQRGTRLETFYSKSDDLQIENPLTYITTSAVNAGCTLHQRRKRQEDAQFEAMWSQSGR